MIKCSRVMKKLRRFIFIPTVWSLLYVSTALCVQCNNSHTNLERIHFHMQTNRWLPSGMKYLKCARQSRVLDCQGPKSWWQSRIRDCRDLGCGASHKFGTVSKCTQRMKVSELGLIKPRLLSRLSQTAWRIEFYGYAVPYPSTIPPWEEPVRFLSKPGTWK